jgi:hypothetical protein
MSSRVSILPVLWLTPALILISGCSSTAPKVNRVFQAGEKAQVGHLTYSIVDVQIHPTLGEDPANPRTPSNRFYTVQVSVSNGGNEDVAIPAMMLMDDAGHAYNELPDGAGVVRWLGMVRRVAPGQTEEGNVLFDAPAAHYRLKLTDETDADEIYADVPLNFVHEVMTNTVGPDSPLPSGSVKR